MNARIPILLASGALLLGGCTMQNNATAQYGPLGILGGPIEPEPELAEEKAQEALDDKLFATLPERPQNDLEPAQTMENGAGALSSIKKAMDKSPAGLTPNEDSATRAMRQAEIAQANKVPWNAKSEKNALKDLSNVFGAPATGRTKGNTAVLEDFDYTLRYRQLMPAGVAMTTEGYVHVISDDAGMGRSFSMRTVKNRRDLYGDPVASMVRENRMNVAMADTANSEPALMRAYRRFCDAGQDMTEEDWQIVSANGGTNGIPKDFNNCLPPK